MCNFCGQNPGQQLHCAKGCVFTVCERCYRLYLPCWLCDKLLCHHHMAGMNRCNDCMRPTPLEPLFGGELQRHLYECTSQYRREMQQWQQLMAVQPVQGFAQLVNANPYAQQPQQIYQPPPQIIPMPQPQGDYVHLDNDRYRHKTNGQIFYIVRKGDLDACTRNCVAAKLYNLFLPGSCVSCEVLSKHPVNGTPIGADDWNFVVKPECATWIPMHHVLMGTNPLCRLVWPATAAVSQLFVHFGLQVQPQDLFTLTQFCQIPLQAREQNAGIIAGWDAHPQLVNANGQVQRILRLHSLALLAWALKDTDMHSMNFGFVPAQNANEWTCFVIDPSGALDSADNDDPTQQQLGLLPACPQQAFDGNGGWHLLGDSENAHVVPASIGGVNAQNGIIEMNQMLQTIRNTHWDQIAPLSLPLNDEELSDWLSERLGAIRDLNDR